jgi:uncharacterized protein
MWSSKEIYMKIRSITFFCNPGWPLSREKLKAAADFCKEAKSSFENAGFEVQTTRLASIPFPLMLGVDHISQAPSLAASLTASLAELGLEYASLGPALPDMPGSYSVIPEALAASKNVFFSGLLTDSHRRISLDAVHRCAELIVRNAPLEPNGFANLNFAALANVPPGVPFFPAAYAGGEDPVFSLAMETADVAVHAFEGAASIDDGRNLMVSILEKNARAMVKAANSLKKKFRLNFGGIDYSLSPFPEESRSIGAAFERLGVPSVGLHGSLAAAAILTETVERAHFPRAGFSGLMMAVLEDAVLSQRAAEGSLSIKDLLLYSAVCGTGLDTIPLAGDTRQEQLVPLLLDLAALAIRLDKPLTARLMPVPGKKVGDATSFDFGFFANSRVLALDAKALKGSLGGDEPIELRSRRVRMKKE